MKLLRSFTLIELIITITIMAIILTVLTGVLTSVVRAQIKTQALSEVKRNGDTVIALIQEAVRTSKSVNVVGDTITFTSQADKDYVIGFVAPNNTTCTNTSKNGYIYMIEGTGNTTLDANKITNDNIREGANVISFVPVIDSSSLSPLVDITMNVDKALCSKYADTDVQRSFKATVSARAFFNGP